MDSYKAQPWHLYVMCLPMLLLGAGVMGYGTGVFWWLGLIVLLIGVGMGLWIGVAGTLQALAEFWVTQAYNSTTLAKNMQIMASIHDPDVWDALGYDMPVPQIATVVQHPAETKPYPKTEFPLPPVSDPKMRQFANAVLRGASMADQEWGGTGKVMSTPDIRKLKRWMRHPDRAYIALVHTDASSQGYTVTPAGEQFLLVYADPELQALFAKRKADLYLIGG